MLKNMSTPVKLVLVLAVLVVCAAAAFAVFGGGLRGNNQPSEENNAPTVEEPSENDTRSRKETDVPELSELDLEIDSDSYSEAEAEIAARLKTGVWVDESETETVVFYDGYYSVIRSDKKEQNHPYVIAAVSERREGSLMESDISPLVDSIAIADDSGYHILYLTRIDGMRPTFYSDDLFGNSEFTQVLEGDEVEIDPLDESLALLAGDDNLDAAYEKILETAIEYYPTTTKAEWIGTAEIDFKEKKIKTTYKFDNKSKTSYAITIDIE